MPALVALLVSMAFTLLAIDHPDVARIAAFPLGAIVIVLLIASARRARRMQR